MAVGEARERVEHRSVLAERLHPGGDDRVLVGDRAQVERRDDVSSMPVEKKRHTSSGGAPDSRETSAITSPYLRRTWSRISGSDDRDVALHEHQQRVPVGQQLVRRTRCPSRRARSPGSALGPRRARNMSMIFSQARSSQARNSSFLVRKSRNRYGWRDARLARDHLGRRAVVAALAEVRHRDREDLLAALLGGLSAGWHAAMPMRLVTTYFRVNRALPARPPPRPPRRGAGSAARAWTP